MIKIHTKFLPLNQNNATISSRVDYRLLLGLKNTLVAIRRTSDRPSPWREISTNTLEDEDSAGRRDRRFLLNKFTVTPYDSEVRR